MKNCVLSALGMGMGLIANAQQPNWQNLDLQQDGVFGISSEKAYNILLKGKTSEKVIVAIIDSGIDITHEDLRDVIWTNSGEIPGNGVDDDNNGYIDDVHGWNFIGGEKGKEDLVNLLRPKKAFYDSLSYTRVPEVYRSGYQEYRKLWNEYPEHVDNPQAYIAELKSSEATLERVIKKMNIINPTVTDFKSYRPEGDEKEVIDIVISRLPYYEDYKSYKFHEIDEILELLTYHLSHGLSMDNNVVDSPRHGNNNGDVSSDIIGPVAPKLTAFHGTHVAGIIAGKRENKVGINGVADNVKIMPLKTISTIREMRDVNLAEAIHYAVDNGAKIINLSFGKPYTWNKEVVDEAVKYAMKMDVLIIHAAGNDGKNLDGIDQFPNPRYMDGSGVAKAWIQVGASGYKNDSLLVAAFSNYGKRSVDVFAPGVAINSTIPYSEYTSYGGTSMAAPIVVGVAAMIRGYYPKLKAEQVKEIIMKSVSKISFDVVVKKEGAKVKIPFSETCVSGGVVNAFAALLLAKQY